MTLRKKQFADALNHIQVVMKKAVVRVEDVEYLLETGVKLLLEFERVYESRENWRLRAEIAEAKLK